MPHIYRIYTIKIYALYIILTIVEIPIAMREFVGMWGIHIINGYI